MDSEILLVQEVKTSGPVELGQIGRQFEVEIGRDPVAGGLTIASQAVSSHHAKIFSLGSYWIFQDQGSTNGSWVNGEQAPPGAFRFLRSGDAIQLADTLLQVTELTGAGHVLATQTQQAPKRSILVLSDGKFIGEYPVPEYGRALVVGGPDGDLSVEGSVTNSSTLLIERKGMFTTLTPTTPQIPITVGGIAVDRPTNLRDGDQVSVSRYTLLFNDPPYTGTTSPVVSSLTGWGGRDSIRKPGQREDNPSLLDKPAQSSVFGRPLDKEEIEQLQNIHDTQVMDAPIPQKRMGRDYHPSMRNAGAEEAGFSLEDFEERFVWIIGFALFIAFLVLLAVWLFAKSPAA